jgi:ABC-type branched-subunit amino acid transport system substrate-binding protein
MQSRRPSVAVATLLALALFTAACGSRLDTAARQQAINAIDGRGTGGSGSTGGTTGGTSTGGTATGGTATGGTTGGTATGGTSTGGTATGGTSTGGSGGIGGVACTPGSGTSIGVTPTEVKVGNVSQITGLVPGFGQTGVNGVKAYFNYINSRGGVCGRKVTLVQSDDRFQSATNRSETQKLAGQVIAFAGSVTVVDDGGAPIIDQANVADVSLATTTPRVQARNNFSPNPIDPTPGAGNGTSAQLDYFKNTYGVKSAAIFYQDVATGVNQAKTYSIDFAKAGIPVAHEYGVPPTSTDFRAEALDMKQRNIDLVITIAEVNAIANLARAFGQIGWFPKVPFYGAQTYGQKFLQLAGSNAENAISALIFHIPEEASTNPAMTTLSTWYARTAPGADLDFFALMGWVAGEMVTRAILGAGPDPTQAKVIDQLKTYTNYQSDYVAPINPAQKKSATCYEVAAVKGGKWQKVFPAGPGFQC